MSRVPKFISRNLIDGILILVFAGAAGGLFVAEVSIPNPSAREVSLFGALEFIVAIIVGWLVQRIAAREEFSKSLRGYAISAYRRISDIQKSVERFRSEIARMRHAYPSDRAHELDMLSALADEMSNTVRSSSYDWADIIGDELEKIRRVETLESELRSAVMRSPSQPDADTNARLADLRKELDALRADLPILVQSSIPGFPEPLPRAERESQAVLDHYIATIRAESCIHLIVEAWTEATEEGARKFKAGVPYSVMEERGMMKFHVLLVDSKQEPLGEVLNPFEASGVYRNDHSYTLMTLLANAFGGPDALPQIIPLPSAHVENISEDGRHVYVRVPITLEMIARG